VTFPTPDAQSPRLLSQQTQSTAPKHSMPVTPPHSTLRSASPMPSSSEVEPSAAISHERATNFATHSWDLASGGLKTLTAKRELPPGLERRASRQLLDAPAARSYMFPLIILACIVVMLISGGIVLFIMVQP
jgi:hypothetical protein